MTTLTLAGAREAVRKNLDEQGMNVTAMYGESVDNKDLDSIIEKTIPEAIDDIHRVAPIELLVATDGAYQDEAISDNILRFRTSKPVLRLVSFRAADSDIVLTDFFPEASAIGRMQKNRYVRGTHDNPVLILQADTLDSFKYYSAGDSAVIKPRIIADYFFEHYIETIDYNYAKAYFLDRNPEANIGHCSSVRSGGFYGRNLDWNYNDEAVVLLRTPAVQGLHAVTGIAGSLAGLTKTLIESGIDTDLYKILPFYLQDGFNDAGVFANINVVIADKGATTVTEPEIEEEDRICSIMLVRYVLDKFSTALDAVNYLRDHVAIYHPKSLIDMGYEVHFMIGDSSNTYIVELIDNSVHIISGQVMTNFYLDDVTLNADGKVYTIADNADGNHPSEENGITLHGSGLERFNIAVDALASANTKAGMRSLMNSLLYSNAYKEDTDPYWYTEFVGEHGITVNTLPTSTTLRDFINAAQMEYAHRSRSNPKVWHTTHSCVYDLNNKKIYVVSQEDTDNEYEFEFSKELEPTHVAQLSYIPYTQKAQSYELSEALLTPIIDRLTGLVLAIYGMNDKASYFFEKSKNFNR